MTSPFPTASRSTLNRNNTTEALVDSLIPDSLRSVCDRQPAVLQAAWKNLRERLGMVGDVNEVDDDSITLLSLLNHIRNEIFCQDKNGSLMCNNDQASFLKIRQDLKSSIEEVCQSFTQQRIALIQGTFGCDE